MRVVKPHCSPSPHSLAGRCIGPMRLDACRRRHPVPARLWQRQDPDVFGRRARQALRTQGCAAGRWHREGFAGAPGRVVNRPRAGQDPAPERGVASLQAVLRSQRRRRRCATTGGSVHCGHRHPCGRHAGYRHHVRPVAPLPGRRLCGKPAVDDACRDNGGRNGGLFLLLEGRPWRRQELEAGQPIVPPGSPLRNPVGHRRRPGACRNRQPAGVAGRRPDRCQRSVGAGDHPLCGAGVPARRRQRLHRAHSQPAGSVRNRR